MARSYLKLEVNPVYQFKNESKMIEMLKERIKTLKKLTSTASEISLLSVGKKGKVSKGMQQDLKNDNVLL